MKVLKAFAILVIVTMLVATTWASLEKNVMVAFADLGRDRWGLATLFDAYFGFLTFYFWVFYKERAWVMRALWLVLLLCFGTIAMASYLLIELYRLGGSPDAERFLTIRRG